MAELDHKKMNEWAIAWAGTPKDSSEKYTALCYLDLQAKLEAEKERRRLIEAQYARLGDEVYEEDGETLKIVAERKAREAMTQSRDEWKYRYGQMEWKYRSGKMDNARIAAEANLRENAIQLDRVQTALKEQLRGNEYLNKRLREVEADYAGCKDTIKDERYCHGQTIASLKNAASEEIKAAKAATIERCAKACDSEAKYRLVRQANPCEGDDFAIQGHKSITAYMLAKAIRALAPERTEDDPFCGPDPAAVQCSDEEKHRGLDSLTREWTMAQEAQLAINTAGAAFPLLPGLERAAEICSDMVTFYGGFPPTELDKYGYKATGVQQAVEQLRAEISRLKGDEPKEWCSICHSKGPDHVDCYTETMKGADREVD